VCERLPDCPHFHLVFTVPEQLHALFEANYREVADALTAAAADTLKQFQKNNWGVDGGFLSVLHTWGSALNWHPHLHVLVAAGGIDRKSGKWKRVRADYAFPVKSLSKVFRGCLLARIEALCPRAGITWPRGWESVEERRVRRLDLAARPFNVFSKATLGNTRAVVRYLARYTSRIAMSNARIAGVDPDTREVRFRWKDYRDGGRVKERRVSGKHFLWMFSRHLVPKGFRRIRYFGWLVRGLNRRAPIPGKPGSIAERAAPKEPRPCSECGATRWTYSSFFVGLKALQDDLPTPPQLSFSLVRARAGP